MSTDFVDRSSKADVNATLLRQMLEDATDQTKAIEVRTRPFFLVPLGLPFKVVDANATSAHFFCSEAASLTRAY